MKILMVVVMENSIWLPWLPPMGFKVYARVVQNPVIVDVKHLDIKRHCKKGLRLPIHCLLTNSLTPVERHDKNRSNHNHLHGDRLNGMQCSNGKRGRLFIFVVHLMEIDIKKREVENAVHPVGAIILVQENNLK